MKREDKNNKKNSPNQTKQKLKGTPFNSADELKSARNQIKMQIWEQLEKAKALKELLCKDEYSHLKEELDEEFKEGLGFRYSNHSEPLVKILSNGAGIEIEINEELSKGDKPGNDLVQAIARSLSASFSNSYYQTKGVVRAQKRLDNLPESLKNK